MMEEKMKRRRRHHGRSFNTVE